MTTFDFDAIATQAASFGQQKDSVRLQGNFNVEVAYASGTTRKKDGSAKNPTLGLKWLVLDGPQIGDEAWYNLVLTDKSQAAFGSNVLALGVPADFLRSLGRASGEDAVRAALETLAEGLVGARYNISVAPQTKNPDFDNTVINTIVEAPDFSDSTPQAQVPVGVAASLSPVAGHQQVITQKDIATVQLGGTASVPGGVIPNLPASN